MERREQWARGLSSVGHILALWQCQLSASLTSRLSAMPAEQRSWVCYSYALVRSATHTHDSPQHGSWACREDPLRPGAPSTSREDTGEPLEHLLLWGGEQAQLCRSPCEAPTPCRATDTQAILVLAPLQPCSQKHGAGSYSLARMTMSMPQKMLMIQPTITMAVRTWMRAAAMFSQKTQHTCLSGRSVRAPHRTVKAETNVPVRGQNGQISEHLETQWHLHLLPRGVRLPTSQELGEKQLASSTFPLRP